MINVVNSKLKKAGQKFHASVHKELLCYYSPYYAAALKGGFSEAKKDTVTIELDHDLMTDLISWLYSGTIISECYGDLIDLYAFADERMMLAFRRSLMTRIIQLQDNDDPMEAEIALPYLKCLPQNSGLFLYLVDYWAGIWSQTDSRWDMAALDSDKRIPRKFFYQALEKLGCMVEDGEPSTIPLGTPCNYHEHYDRSEWRETCGQLEGPPIKNVKNNNPDFGYYHKP